MTSRRDFVRQLGGAALASALPLPALRAARGSEMKLGYASITWGGNDARAIDEIASLGFPGIQLRANVVDTWRPEQLRALLAARKLTFAALSSGNISSEAAERQRMIDLHVGHARYLRDAGGLNLQLIDERPRGRDAVPDDYRRLGEVMSEIGRQSNALGVTVVYHPHMGSMGETPEGSAAVLEASDPAYVKLLLDVAHYRAGGGDPIAAIHTYRARLRVLHLKDLRHFANGGKRDFEFVELGRGEVDLPGVFATLREQRFDGWGIVELDSVPKGGGTPKESAEISKAYLAKQVEIGF